MFNLSRIERNERLGHVTSFRNLLPEILKRFDLQQEFTIGTLKNAWPEIAGDIIAANTSPERVENSILFVKSAHPVFANEIALLKTAILTKLNDKFKTSLKDIRVQR